MRAPAGRFVAGALTLGFGLGGLADGIVLHQVLQWHHLVTARVPADTVDGLRSNVLADGIFHLGTTALLVAGLLLLWRAQQDRRALTGNLAALAGLALVGWGAFHVVDQLVFHLALGLHDIRQDAAAPWAYNWGFFLVGLLLAAGGVALCRRWGRLGRPSAVP